MKITLLVEGIRPVIDLTEAGIPVGRGDAAIIRVASNAVSRVHAQFFLQDGKPHVIDLKSLNEADTLFQPLASMAGKLLRAAGQSGSDRDRTPDGRNHRQGRPQGTGPGLPEGHRTRPPALRDSLERVSPPGPICSFGVRIGTRFMSCP